MAATGFAKNKTVMQMATENALTVENVRQEDAHGKAEGRVHTFTSDHSAGIITCNMLVRLGTVVCLLALMPSCAGMIGKRLARTFTEAERALQAYPDLKTIEAAMPGNLLMLENIVRGFPENKDLLIAAAKAYAAYAQGFVEDEDPARAKTLYWRGQEFGWRALMENKCFRKRLEAKPANPDWYDLAQCFTRKDEVPYLAWTAAAWGGWLKLSMQEEDANFEIFFDAVPVREFMDRARVLDENYYYGVPLLFFGILYTQMPPMAGGGREKAEETFQKVFRISEGKFLLAKVMYARFLLAAIKDREAFTKTLNDVIEAPDDLLPEARLANAIAKRKARIYLDKMEEFF